VKYGLVQDAYLDYLTVMKRWYDKGILDPDFAASDAKMLEAYMINGEAAGGFGGGNIYTAVEAKGIEGYNLVGVPYPVLEEGDEPFMINMA
jgi:putative aldouronate transport system substrate-binding protein